MLRKCGRRAAHGADQLEKRAGHAYCTVAVEGVRLRSAERV